MPVVPPICRALRSNTHGFSSMEARSISWASFILNVTSRAFLSTIFRYRQKYLKSLAQRLSSVSFSVDLLFLAIDLHLGADLVEDVAQSFEDNLFAVLFELLGARLDKHRLGLGL